MSGCILDECRFYDPVTGEWGYAVVCVRTSHADRDRCPGEHEMFRTTRSA